MHIADGVLPVEIYLGADAVALAAIYAGGRNVSSDDIPRMGIFAAGLFIVSLIHFPLAGTSIHLGLYGLAGLLFGMRAIPIIFVDLLFQALVFQHGGLLSLGINTLTMGSGAIAGWLTWKVPHLAPQLKSFLCGFLGILLPAFFLAVILVLQYGNGMTTIAMVYIPTAVLEGMLTVFIIYYFKKVKPGLIK